MDEKLMESYLNSISELVIDENKIVTYKSLSKTLGIHVNTAKQLLYTYLSREKSKNLFPISATHLIAGKLQDGSLNISIVNDDDLKSICSKFAEITSEHVYSIQKCKNLQDVKLLCRTDEKFSNIERPPVIKCSKCVLKSGREVRKRTDDREDKNKIILESALAAGKETQPVKTCIGADSFASKENISKTPVKKSPSKKSPKGSFTKGQTDTKKPMGNIANLFAKAAQKNAEKSIKNENVTCENKQEKGQMDSKDIPVHAAAEVEVSEKTEKKNLKKTNEAKDNTKKKKSGNKRKRIQMLSDSEDSESSNEEETLSVDSPLAFVENVEEIKEEQKESLPRNKRKKRKVIDRTVMNEDGYLETKKEVVFETDSEDEVVEERKPDPEQKKTKLAPVSDKGKGSFQSTNAAKKQSSLLNFFKKN